MLHGAVGLSYGRTDRLTVSAALPYVRRDGLRAGTHHHHGGHAMNEVMEVGSVSGVGDASVLAKYKLIDGKDASLSLIGGLKLPTGSTDKNGNDGERLDTEHQPGSGSWDGIFGAAFGTKFGDFNLTASGVYHISGKGAQSTRLGDRAQAGIAISPISARPNIIMRKLRCMTTIMPKAETTIIWMRLTPTPHGTRS